MKEKDFESIYKDSDAVEARMGVNFTDLNSLITQRAESKTKFLIEDLAAIEDNFYNLMLHRGRSFSGQSSKNILAWLSQNKSTLEPITNKLLLEPKAKFFSVDGMYGGFSYSLFERDGKPVLITDSWVRISSGSGQRHEITPQLVEMVATFPV